MGDPRKMGWGWPGDPNSATEARFRRDNIVTITVQGINLPINRKVTILFAGFVNEIVAKGYDVDDVRDDWGFANRPMKSGSSKSKHAYGLAVDINATKNPYRADGRLITDMPPWIAAIAAKYGLGWGGNWNKPKDPMHFEFDNTVDAAARLVAGLTSSQGGGIKVPRQYDPPLQVISTTVTSRGHGYMLFTDGGIGAVGGAPAILGPNVKDYFRGHTAAKIWPSDDAGAVSMRRARGGPGNADYQPIPGEVMVQTENNDWFGPWF